MISNIKKAKKNLAKGLRVGKLINEVRARKNVYLNSILLSELDVFVYKQREALVIKTNSSKRVKYCE